MDKKPRMEVARFIAEMVEPTVADFESNPTSVRHAFLACVATFHIIDYLKGSRQKYQQASADFAEVDRIAHAFKHAEGRGGKMVPLVAEDVIKRPPALWDEGIWGLSRWGDETGGVTIQGEHELDVLECVKRALVFLKAQAAAGS